MKIQNNGTDVALQPILNFTNPTSITNNAAAARLDIVLPGGGGGGAPTTADYLVKTADAGLSAERVVTDTTTITWDWATGGQAKANAVTLVGDSGAGGAKGVAPAPGAGDAAAGKFLKADGTWTVPPEAPTVGTATIDFGAFPGASDTSIAVTGQAGIVSGSVVQAWLRPAATADHTADEHWIETIKVVAGNIVESTGFTIYAINTNQINEPLQSPRIKDGATVSTNVPDPSVGGQGTRIYGQWAVAWSWQ